MALFSRTDRSFLGQWWWTIDRGLLGCFIMLMILGVMMVATASPPVAESHHLGSYHFLIRHIILLVPAFCIMMVVSTLSMRMIWRVASILFIASIFCMLLVPFIGMEIKGAQRWIHLPGFSFQPSEFVKPAFAIVGAWFMSIQKTRAGFPGYVITAVLWGITVTLLLMQPDFGMTFVVTAIWASMIFLAGFPFRLLTGLAALAAGGAYTAYYTFDHVRSRIDRFFNPDSGDNYQVNKSIEAFQNGGLFGTGPGQGTVKLGLPDAHADFIFSVAGEEMGLIFVLILIALFGYVLLRGFNRLMDSDNMFVVLAVGGLLTMFGLQAMVHMGSSLNILPAKGMTLPFISYGGSSILSMSFSMGAVLALSRRQTRSSVSKAGLSLRPRLKAAKTTA